MAVKGTTYRSDAQGTDPSELHSGSRPHPGRRQSQYSWAHMDPSAHSLAFRGGAEVPDEEYEVQNLYTEDAQGGDTEMYRAANRYRVHPEHQPATLLTC